MFNHIINYSGGVAISAVLSIILLPFFTRVLTPQDFGIIAIYGVFGNLTASLLSIGLQSATYRFYFKNYSAQDYFGRINYTNFVFIIFLFILGGIFVFFTSNYISVNIFDSKISKNVVIISYLGGCISNLYRYLRQLLTIQERSKAFSIISILDALFKPGIAIILILLFSLTYQAKIFGMIITELLFLFILLYLHRNFFTIKWSFSSLKKSIIFSYPTIPSQIINLGYQSFDKVMLTKLKSLNSVGHYSIAHRIGGANKIFMGIILRAWTPFFMRNAELRTSKSKKIIVERHFDIIMIFNILAIFICCFSEELITLLTTEDFYFSMYLIPIIVFSGLFVHTLGSMSKQQLAFGEKMIYVVPPNILGLIINIILNIILIPMIGVLGAVFSTLIASIFSGSLLFYYGQKVFPLPLNYTKIIGQITFFILFLIPIYFLMFSNLHLVYKFLLKVIMLIIYFFLLVKIKFIDFARFFSLIKRVIPEYAK